MRALHPDAMADLRAQALRLARGIPRLGGLLRYLVLLVPIVLILPAIILTLQLFAPDHPLVYRSYLPATMRLNQSDVDRAADFSMTLSRMDEPVLHGPLPDGIAARFRLLEQPSWGPYRSVRIEVARDGHATALVTQLSYSGRLVHCRYRRSLNPETSATLQRLAAPAMGAQPPDNVFSFDGTSWLLEMRTAAGYRFMDFDSAQARHSPILPRMVTELQQAGMFWNTPCIVQLTASTLGF